MRRTTFVGVLLAVCLLVSIGAGAAGCAQSGTSVGESAPTKPLPSYVGPFGRGTAVVLGDNKITLETVEVSDLEWPYADPSSAAPEGRKWVFVDFAFEGPQANPSPGGGRFYPNYQLIADGQPLEMDLRSSGGDGEAPPGVVPHEYLTFQVPEDVHALVMCATPKEQLAEEPQVLGFRLW